jgi:hypothetical protein
MLAHNYPFDTVQLPLNCFDGTYRSFEQQVLPELERRGIAALGMKSLGGDGQPILHGVVGAEEALRYAMSLPVLPRSAASTPSQTMIHHEANFFARLHHKLEAARKIWPQGKTNLKSGFSLPCRALPAV